MTLTALPEKEIDTSLDIINSIDPNIKFTLDIEIDGKLPFHICYS